MDFSALSNNTLSAASAPASGTEPAAGGSGAGGGSSAFSGVLQSLLPPQERQDIAAPEASGKAEMAFFAAQTPGMQLEIITPATPMPGEDSLAAFARNQGLNETAIQALFGPAAWFSGANAGLAQTTQQTPPLLAEANPSAELVSPPLNDFFALWSLGAAPGSALASSQTASAPTTGAPAPLAPTSSAPNAAALALLTTQSLTADKTLSATEEAPFSIHNLVVQQPQPTPDELARMDDATAIQLRLAVQPHSLTTRLMNMQGTDVAQTWSQLMTTVNQPQAGKTEELVLEIGADLLQALEPQDVSLEDTLVQSPHHVLPTEAGPKAANASPTLVTSSPLPSAEPQQRAEQIQQLADKMGQALAERLQQQIAKGEWSLQLRMNPAQLGQVDVSLDMSAAGLDAVFQSDNPLTRELIALGSNKLKDSLTQSGMTVASVWVNGGGERQAGGNPTQQQKQQPSPTKATAETAGPEIRSSHSRIMRPDGWDVLA